MYEQEWKWNKRKNIFDLLEGADIWVTLVSFDVISLNASILKLAITHIFQIFKNSISRKSGITHYNDNQQRSISLDYSTSYTTMSKHFHLRIPFSKCGCVHVCVCASEREKEKNNKFY